MIKLILIPAAQTEWNDQDRLVGDTDLALNAAGRAQAVTLGQAASAHAPASIHSGREQPTKETAAAAARELGLRSHYHKELREIDLGLWEGLRVEDLRDRFGRVYKQWRSDPLSVEPPEGEDIRSVATRLTKAVAKIIKRETKEGPIALVLGRFNHAILRCDLGDGNFEKFWEYVDGDAGVVAIEYAMNERG